MTLHYRFPYLDNFDKIKHIFENNEHYVIADKGDYIVINYIHSGKETHPIVTNWEESVLREARGLIFSKQTGQIISRRFQKFFNLGEREDVIHADLSRPHIIMEKLDGSMVTALNLPGGLRWATKMGVTDVSLQAEAFVAKNPKYIDFANYVNGCQHTAIFEWVSRQQRIVVDYPEDNLILTAIRNNKTGRYVTYKNLQYLSDAYDIPLVKVISSEINDQEKLIEYVRNLQGIEGFVIQFDDGHMIKIKTDEYVTLHRAKSLLDNERDVVELILTDKVDDLLPLLNEYDRTRLTNFIGQIWNEIYVYNKYLTNILTDIKMKGMSKKDFALAEEYATLPAVTRSFIFQMMNQDQFQDDMVWKYILKNLGSKKAYEKCNSIITTKWKEIKIND